MRCVGGISGV